MRPKRRICQWATLSPWNRVGLESEREGPDYWRGKLYDMLAKLEGIVAVSFWICSMPQDYYASLANLVRSSASDDAQKRRAIYALARSELRQFLARQRVNGSGRAQDDRHYSDLG